MLAHTSQTTLHKKNLQCFLDLSGPTLHNEITYVILAYIWGYNLCSVVLTMLGQHCIVIYCLVNVVQIHLREHCTRKLLLQCWTRALRHVFRGKYPIQSCLDLSVPTLHTKTTCVLHTKTTCAVFIQSPRTTLHRKIISIVVLVYAGQHCTRNLPVQCWPMVDKQLFLAK